ncbi:hypothetical protein J7T55_007684 [Diaporthe amygdali]|uniref:uncharacterized protein n=1 Tax=Phomopsis amygdali TaxID=1214568 RepID=UPI0022FE9491|nr:uncharacterized protein J7T55_007684 [Diaporthe amygdali]KAJ0107495.1 hypothetical protein J7T55_007684 [Diaporthe amygdali]
MKVTGTLVLLSAFFGISSAALCSCDGSNTDSATCCADFSGWTGYECETDQTTYAICCSGLDRTTSCR